MEGKAGVTRGQTVRRLSQGMEGPRGVEWEQGESSGGVLVSSLTQILSTANLLILHPLPHQRTTSGHDVKVGEALLQPRLHS